MEPAKDLPPVPEEAEIADLRFRALMPEDEWASLPAAIRARFTTRLGPGETKIYAGRVTEVRMSLVGRVLSQLARLIGAPFPLSRDTGTAGVVTVTETQGGQVWTRLYARRRGLPQIIHSTKLFRGPTGLEEHVGGGVCMRLKLFARARDLVFESRGFCIAGVALPRALMPVVTVTHVESGGGAFVFHLDVVHPRLGELIHQSASFRESKP